MPKRFKIKGSGKLIEYEKDATSPTGLRRKKDMGGCAVGKKEDMGGCSVGKKKSPFGNNSVVRNNPEIFKRLGIEDMAIPDWAYERKDPDPTEMSSAFVKEMGGDENVRLYRRNKDNNDYHHYDNGEWIPSNDPDDIYYEGGGYGYNEFDTDRKEGYDFISVNTQGEDPRSHFQFTKDNIGKKKRILPEERLTMKDFKPSQNYDFSLNSAYNVAGWEKSHLQDLNEALAFQKKHNITGKDREYTLGRIQIKKDIIARKEMEVRNPKPKNFSKGLLYGSSSRHNYFGD